MRVRQTNFSAGELSPALRGRTDLPLFAKGLRTCRNFLLAPHGAAVSRPGLLYMTDAEGPSKLVPFVFSDSEAYVLEFGELYVRVHQPTIFGLTERARCTTPYGYGSLSNLKWVQSGDVLLLTCEGYAPQELRRYDNTTWEFGPAELEPPEPYFVDVNDPAATQTTEPMAVDDGGANVFPTVDVTNGFPALEWQYMVTLAVYNTSDGRRNETTAVPVESVFDGVDVGTAAAIATRFPVAPEKPVTLRRMVPAAPITPPDGWESWRPYAINVYRGRGGVYGLVGQTTGRDFIDSVEFPEYTIQPPLGRNPFVLLDHLSQPIVPNDYPLACAYFEDRRVYAGTPKRPATVFLSAVGWYGRFDLYLPVPGPSGPTDVRNSGLEFDMTMRHRENILSCVAIADRLVLLTNSSVQSLAGGQGEALSSTIVSRRLESSIGANRVPPLVVGDTLYYLRDKAAGVQALSFGPDGTRGVDASFHAQHMFIKGSSTALVGAFQVVDWCYADNPFSTVYAVRNDGMLLTMGRDGGWATHDTPNGLFKSVCSIPGTYEDEVYAVVRRERKTWLTINGAPVPDYNTVYTIERFASRVPRSATDNVCHVDCAVSVAQVGAGSLTISGLEVLEGREVWVLPVGAGDPQGPFTVSHGAITLSRLLPEIGSSAPGGGMAAEAGSPTPLVANYRAAYVGEHFSPELETLDFLPAETRLQQKTVRRVGIEVETSRGLMVGPDLQHLHEVKQRTVATGYDPLSPETTVVDVPISGRWDNAARVALRQAQPAPLTVVGLVREVEGGG